jgi:Uma2 family endonuclease
MGDLFTRADYDRLPESFPAQLIEGCLVKSPSPRYGHQHVVRRLLLALARRCDEECVLPAPTDVILDEYNVYQPDVVVFREPPPAEGRGEVLPAACFEVLSPTTEERDRRHKLPRLLAAGVEEVWLLDHPSRTIEVHDRDGVRRASGPEAIASIALAGFLLVPDEVFARPTRR